MARTVSGHPAARSYGDPRLRTRTVPGTTIRLTTMRPALPLYLHLAKRLNRKVRPLSVKDTWSIAMKPPAAGPQDAHSDHEGWACDFWASTIGAHTWPSRMPDDLAKIMLRIVSSYRTADGRRIFGWGAHESQGGDYTKTVNSDPMHVFVRPGITAADLRECRRRMGIRLNGRNKRRRK